MVLDKEEPGTVFQRKDLSVNGLEAVERGPKYFQTGILLCIQSVDLLNAVE